MTWWKSDLWVFGLVRSQQSSPIGFLHCIQAQLGWMRRNSRCSPFHTQGTKAWVMILYYPFIYKLEQKNFYGHIFLLNVETQNLTFICSSFCPLQKIPVAWSFCLDLRVACLGKSLRESQEADTFMLFFHKYTCCSGDVSKLYGKIMDFSELDSTWEDV